MSTKNYRTLESLPAEKQEMALEIAAHAARLMDVLPALKEQGIEVSLSTLKRFLRKHRQDHFLEEEADLKGMAQELTERGKSAAWREGTLAAAEQKMFEKALKTGSSEEALEVFRTIKDEEARRKELELAARRTAAMEERLELERERLARLGGGEGRARKRTQIEGSAVVEVGRIETGERMVEWSKVAPLVEMLSRVSEILNRGGEEPGKVVEARRCLAGAEKLLGFGGG